MLQHIPPDSSPFLSGEYQNILFERVNRDDMEEIRNYRNRITELENRCLDLEKINSDLENRLERQARERMDYDREFAENNHEWEKKLQATSVEIDGWRERLENEVRHGNIARDKLRRTERELYRILQKKYDIVREAKLEERTAGRERDRIAKDLALKAEMTGLGTYSSTPKLTSNPHGAGPSSIRERQVIKSLSDFFGI
jgi:myosin heavy subunit